MNNEIKAKVMAIFEAALDLNALGHYHAFAEVSPHVKAVSVRIVAAGTDYHAESYPVASEQACYCLDHYLWLTSDERAAQVDSALNAVLALINSHATFEIEHATLELSE